MTIHDRLWRAAWVSTFATVPVLFVTNAHPITFAVWAITYCGAFSAPDRGSRWR